MRILSHRRHARRQARRAFTLAEVLISMTIVGIVMMMCMSTFMLGFRTMYKDGQRLATNASLRRFMAQISKETLDASYFYLFRYYNALDGDVNLTNDPSPMTQIENAADDDYDKWVAHGDCLVLVTRTSLYRTTDIRSIRVFYRLTTSQAAVNTEAVIRYYEIDFTEGTSAASNGHTNLTTELNLINLASNSAYSGGSSGSVVAKNMVLNTRTMGRRVSVASSPYVVGDRYPVFSSESPDATVTNGFISINLEFINGSTVNNMLSSSSFNYTISPRR